jgi:hypothetical protein
MPWSSKVIFLVLVSLTPSSGQDWRTSSEDPCACTDSRPFIIGGARR